MGRALTISQSEGYSGDLQGAGKKGIESLLKHNYLRLLRLTLFRQVELFWTKSEVSSELPF